MEYNQRKNEMMLFWMNKIEKYKVASEEELNKMVEQLEVKIQTLVRNCKQQIHSVQEKLKLIIQPISQFENLIKLFDCPISIIDITVPRCKRPFSLL